MVIYQVPILSGIHIDILQFVPYDPSEARRIGKGGYPLKIIELLNREVEIEISGKTKAIRGKLVDWGQDIVVMHNGHRFLYVPLRHLQQMRASESRLDYSDTPEQPFEQFYESVSYRKILMSAKGMFAEINITGNQSVHGYITSIMNDFFVFYSPVYHSIVIPLHQLKYLIPYDSQVTPYTLTPEQFPLKPSPVTLARTFDQQLRKLIGKFVILDLGENPNKIGILKQIDGQIVELASADGKSVFLHFDHIKTVHLP